MPSSVPHAVQSCHELPRWLIHNAAEHAPKSHGAVESPKPPAVSAKSSKAGRSLTEHKLSPLYCRYNGFTLGAFLASIRLPYTQRRYDAFRELIVEFLEEAGLQITMPRSQTLFARRFDEIFSQVLASVRARSETLSDFVGLGAMAVLQASSGALVSHAQRHSLRDRWCPVLEKHGVPRSAYDEWARLLPTGKARIYAEDVLSPASFLLAQAIEPLEAEPDTCFVAMPFRRPFLGYFTALYRPAVERAGMRAIRAWGGLSSEEYYMFLLTLISRSGAVLAELSTLNLNVINEVGVAHGIPRVVFLIGRKPLRNVPSNIAHLPIHLYDDRRRQWLPGAVRTCAEYMQWMRRDFDLRYGQAYRDAVEAHLRPGRARGVSKR